MELERRHFPVEGLEVRADDDGNRTVRGLAVPYNRKSGDMGGWQEVIAKGAATASVLHNDIVMLWQHDTANPISRVGANRAALVVEERASGVWFEQDATALSDFQLAKIADGVVREMSFGFFAEEQAWDEDSKPVLRTITQMNLVEISPVTFAAYGQATKVDVRCAVEAARRAGIVLPCMDSDEMIERELEAAANAEGKHRMVRNRMNATLARIRLGF